MSKLIKTFLIVLLGLPAPGQQTSPSPQNQSGKQAPQARGKPGTLTVDGLLSMVEAGLSDEVIIAKLRSADKAFDLSPDDMIRLKKAKVSDAVLRVMLDPKTEVKPSAGLAVTLAPPKLAPTLTGIAPANPSGATPTNGTEPIGDQNDPMTPHDSGIYVLTKDREGKPVMVVLERAAYQGSKTGGTLGSVITYGIKKAKTKAVIPGPRASLRVSDPSPVFYFYFEDKQAGLGKSSFGVSNLSNPNQFALLKLEVTKSSRETVIGQFSVLGTSSGSDSKAMIPFKSERIRAGLYRVVVDGIKAGEYCFLASSGSTLVSAYGAYGAGATGAVDIFDFGVSME